VLNNSEKHNQYFRYQLRFAQENLDFLEYSKASHIDNSDSHSDKNSESQCNSVNAIYARIEGPN